VKTPSTAVGVAGVPTKTPAECPGRRGSNVEAASNPFPEIVIALGPPQRLTIDGVGAVTPSAGESVVVKKTTGDGVGGFDPSEGKATTWTA
jgi:hypothetical protein